VLDQEREVARVLAQRDRRGMTPQEVAGDEERLCRAILILWQTSLLRLDRPSVIDEVANGLSFYDLPLLRDLAHVYGALEDQLAAYDPAFRNGDLPSFMRMGSWIGGDRDGNPFVDAEVLDRTMRMQSQRAFDFYLEELHSLGGELSLDSIHVSVSSQLQDLADRSPDSSPRRAIATSSALSRPALSGPWRERRSGTRLAGRSASSASRDGWAGTAAGSP